MVVEPKSNIGRPSKLTAELKERFMDLLEAGNYPEVAASACGIGRTTYYRWMEQGKADEAAGKRSDYRDFREQIERARDTAETHYVGILMRNANEARDTKAAVEWLQRSAPDRWGRKDQLQLQQSGSLTINGGVTDDEIIRRCAANPGILKQLAALESDIFGQEQPSGAGACGEPGAVEIRPAPAAAKQ
jgi:hypothetical protein